MFDRSPQTMLCCNWFTSAFEVVSRPGCPPAAHAARPVTIPAVGVVPAGSPVTIRLDVTTVETPACTYRLSPRTVAVKLVSGSDRIWSSQDCPASIASALSRAISSAATSVCSSATPPTIWPGMEPVAA